MKVRYKPTGQLGEIPDDRFDPSLFEQVDQPAQPSVAPAVAPTQQAQPMQDTSYLQQLSDKGLLGKILSAVIRPGVEGASYMAGSGIGIGAGLAGAFGNKNAEELALRGDIPFLTPEQEARFRGQSSAPVIEEGLRKGAGLATYALPVGKGVQAFATGGVRGGLSAGSNEGASAADITMGVAGGGLTEGVIANLLPFLAKSGAKNRQSVAKPETSVKADPFYAENVNKLAKTQSEIGLKGNASSQLEQLPNKFREVDAQAKSILQNATPIKAKQALTDYADEVGKIDYLGDENTFVKEMNILNKRITTAASKDSPMGIYNLKSELGNEIAPVLKKIQVGNPLLPKEAARFAAYKSLKKTLDGVSPEIRKLNNLQAQLYDLSEGLVSSAKDPGGLQIPFVGKVGGESIQSGKDFLGRILEAGNVVPQEASDITAAVGAIAQGQGMPSPQATTQATPDITNSLKIQTDASTSPAGNDRQITPEIMQVARMTLTDKEYAKLKDVYDLQQGKADNATVAKRKQAISSAETVYNQLVDLALQAPAGGKGYLQSVLGTLPGVEGGTAEDLKRQTEGFAKAIASAFAGEVGVATDQDVQRWLGLMPKPGDTYEERVRALQRMKQQIDASKAQYMK